MRIILLTHGGADLVIEHLANLKNIEFAGVFIETKPAPMRTRSEKIKRSIRYDGYFETVKKFLAQITKSKTAGTEDMQKISESRNLTVETAKKYSIPVTFVEDYHDEKTLNLLNTQNADLGIVFGTNIIRESVFSIPKFGSINLHQGLAPQYRGGPPVFWELFNDEKEVGLTVHFVAAKVDTGDIVLQKTVPLIYDYRFGDNFEGFLEEFKSGLKEISANLLAKAVELIESGSFSRLRQDITQGKRYRLPIKSEKDELKKRLRLRKNRK